MSGQINLFWWRWLLVVTSGVIVYSLSLIVAPGGMRRLFDTWFLAPNTVLSAEVSHYLNFIYGVLGAVIVGWMTALLSILMGAFRRRERAAWNTITLSLVVWFVIDTGFSVAVGELEHALFNVVFLVLFAIPLAATYRQFHSQDARH